MPHIVKWFGKRSIPFIGVILLFSSCQKSLNNKEQAIEAIKKPIVHDVVNSDLRVEVLEVKRDKEYENRALTYNDIEHPQSRRRFFRSTIKVTPITPCRIGMHLSNDSVSFSVFSFRSHDNFRDFLPSSGIFDNGTAYRPIIESGSRNFDHVFGIDGRTDSVIYSISYFSICGNDTVDSHFDLLVLNDAITPKVMAREHIEHKKEWYRKLEKEFESRQKNTN